MPTCIVTTFAKFSQYLPNLLALLVIKAREPEMNAAQKWQVQEDRDGDGSVRRWRGLRDKSQIIRYLRLDTYKVGGGDERFPRGGYHVVDSVIFTLIQRDS